MPDAEEAEGSRARRGAVVPGGGDGGESGAARDSRNVFVTVGTTSFDALIEAMDCASVVATLRAKGYTSLTLQIGRGLYLPRNIVPPGASRAVLRGGGSVGEGAADEDNDEGRDEFVVEYFDFKPSLEQSMRWAALVVSHAGAGSVFEALGLRRPLLVVVNETLMGNHQVELAEELAGRGHLQWCTPADLKHALVAFEPKGLTTYTPGNPVKLAAAFDTLLG